MNRATKPFTSSMTDAPEYLSKNRYVSYHNQVRLLFSLGKQVRSVLEIGIFNSLFTEVLKKNHYLVTTADIDPGLNPDLVIDISEDITLEHNTYDVICLFQVLEHIPYDKAELALQKLARSTKQHLLISIPYNATHLAMRFKVSFIQKERYLFSSIPRFWSRQTLTKEQHYWEMGMRGYPKKRILASFTKTGLTVQHEFVDHDNPYHYFFILKKK